MVLARVRDSFFISFCEAEADARLVYAYIPTTATGFCSEANIICNSDYGTSLDRGSFTFVTGQWQTIWLMVILNEVVQ